MIEDKSTYFKDFGVDITLEKEGRVIRGFFDSPVANLTIGHRGVAGQLPQILCDTDDVNEVKKNDLITVKGNRFVAWTNEPDGTGMSKVTLQHENRDKVKL